MTAQSVKVKRLRPTQIAVGQRLVNLKRKGLREREKKPQELVDFILANPIRVVAGPKSRLYVIDHHHLAHALQDEGFDTAPVVVFGDLSRLSMADFWKEMEAKAWVHPFDGHGQEKPVSAIPKKIAALEDDAYRSLAGFVRLRGGFEKSPMPFAEFVWADFYRKIVPEKLLRKDFKKALRQAQRLAGSKEAEGLPGYLKKAEKSGKKDDQ